MGKGGAFVVGKEVGLLIHTNMQCTFVIFSF